MKKICVFVGSRANYSSIKSVMMAVQNHPQLELQLIIGSSAVLDRFGKVEDLIIKDGFTPNFNFYNIVEGENPVTMAKSTGLGLIECSMIFNNLKPDYLVVVGDRFEMMSVTIAAAYMNIRIAHTMGGEVTGTIDESIRHAITKFAHIHFAASEDAKERILKLGETPEHVHNVGCPRMDLVLNELKNDSHKILGSLFENFTGVGPSFLDLTKPYLLVSQHPVTTEFGSTIGTPVVNIGTRQNKREMGPNVINVGYDRQEIKEAILTQIAHGKYENAGIYGDGHAGTQIADILASSNPSIQKTITY
jgi:UDP-hydrolysing UDP-N-acetyl-D-glucosamine 2-epimerase